MRISVTIAGVVGVLVASFAVVTGLALEGGEVVVLRTRSDAGVRETRVWIADADDATWLEAAHPESPWYRDVLDEPVLEVVRDGRNERVCATPRPGLEGHARIRALFRGKYGWRDAWVAALQDGSRSVAVRVEPCPGAQLPLLDPPPPTPSSASE